MTEKATPKSGNGFANRIANFVLPPAAWLLCRALGLFTWCFTDRGKDAMRNLALAFPERDAAWHRRIAFKSIMRMFEMFAIPMVLPWLSERELRKRFHFKEGAEERFSNAGDAGASVMQTPHCAMSESLVLIPLLHPSVKLTTVYRPLDFPPAERYVKWVRSHWGMHMLSRKEGLLGLRRVLGKGQSVAILFDQNALSAGALILSFGRVCSATDLPGILAEKMHIPTLLGHARRTGFLKAEFDFIPVPGECTSANITTRSALLLENILRKDEDTCADWMWAHRRWKGLHCRHTNMLTLSAQKKSYIEASLAAMGIDAIPRRQPYILRVPDAPAKARQLAEWMPRLREARPDVRWIVLAHEMCAHAFIEGENCERLVTYRRESYETVLRSLSEEWPDFLLSLEPDGKTRREAARCNARISLGLSTKKGRNKTPHQLLMIESRQTDIKSFGSLLETVFEHCGLGRQEKQD